MKRCPTCGSTYTNDDLVFCLEDGAALLRVSDSASPADFRPRGAPTLRQSPTPLTTPEYTPPGTGDHPGRRTDSSTKKSTSPVIVAGITAIVVLLLVIAGIGVALLVRNYGSGTRTENDNRAGSRESGGNASNRASDSNSEKGVNTANRAGANDAVRNSSASTDAAGRAEAKVLRGSLLEESDLASLSREELRRLRNAVYARHGRTFDSQDLQRYFDSRPWYRPRSDYDEASLTETDRANIKLIQTIENSRA